jgi:hypothetical protein
MSEEQTDTSKSRNIYYPLMIVIGIAGNILSAFSQLQAIYSTLGIFVSTLLIGVGIIGFFVNQKRISLRDGILYAVIWIMLMALAVAGYYILISRASSVYGILLDNANTRNAVSDVDVSLYLYSTGATNHVRTNERGEFRFDDVSHGEFDVIINDVSIYSGDIPNGLRKLIEANVNTGRFYLANLGGTSVSTGQTPLPPSNTVAPTLIATPTSRPTNTPRPPTNTPTLTSIPTEIPQESILYEEDFDETTSIRTIPSGGTWRVTQDDDGNNIYLGGTEAQSSVFSIGSSEWSNYVIELNFILYDTTGTRGVVWNDFEICIRCSNAMSRGYNLKINASQRHIFWERNHDLFLGEAYGVNLPTNEWLPLHIEADGGVLRASINDTWISDVFNTTITTGGVYIAVAEGLSVAVDDIRVWSLDSD